MPQPIQLAPDAIQALRTKLSTRGLAICLSGIDGCGKTTLARNLLSTLDVPGVSTRMLHIYSWYLNLVLTPWLIIRNRYFDRGILVLDRTILDNTAVLATRRHCPRWLFRVLVSATACGYPKFDYSFHLFASFAETSKRRPDTLEWKFDLLTGLYAVITQRLNCTRLQSNEHVLSKVIASLIDTQDVRGQ